jgi:hypothetical protein
MISIVELVKKSDHEIVTDDDKINLARVHYTLNFCRKLTPFPWIIDRGFSTPEDQIAIYEAKGLKPKMGSCHLIGAAADIHDPKGVLKKWILDNLQLVEELKVFLESFDATSTWVHWQIFPYGSWVPGKSHFFEP